MRHQVRRRPRIALTARSHAQGANQDVEVTAAVAIQIAERARVCAAADAFELGDDFHAAHFRATGNGPTRKHRGDHLPRRYTGPQTATYIRDDVMHMRITLNRHEFIDFDATG